MVAESGKACADISGVYVEIGEAAPSRYGCGLVAPNCYLSDHLLSVNPNKAFARPRQVISHVEIAQPGGTSLQVALWRGDNLLQILSINLGDDSWTCEGDAVVNRGSEFHFGAPGALRKFEKTFRKAQDGSLNLAYHSVTTGMHFLPIRVDETGWIRWEPARTH